MSKVDDLLAGIRSNILKMSATGTKLANAFERVGSLKDINESYVTSITLLEQLEEIINTPKLPEPPVDDKNHPRFQAGYAAARAEFFASNDLNFIWTKAPAKAEYGDGMMVGDVPLGNDATMTVYAHKDDVPAASSLLINSAKIPKLPNGVKGIVDGKEVDTTTELIEDVVFGSPEDEDGEGNISAKQLYKEAYGAGRYDRATSKPFSPFDHVNYKRFMQVFGKIHKRQQFYKEIAYAAKEYFESEARSKELDKKAAEAGSAASKMNHYKREVKSKLSAQLKDL